MNIVQITPSSGDSFYCENCLRDAELTAQMGRLGHDVSVLPMYLPLPADWQQHSTGVQISPIFFGGINVYLQQKSTLFRKTPRWLDKFLDNPYLLRLAGRKAGLTSAKELGQTTLSMLEGSAGRQKKELDRLLDWLAGQDKPDVVVLSNILLIGLVNGIKEKLGLPVVILLQDEDGFLDSLGSPYAQQAWDIVAKTAKNVNLFVAVSRYFGSVMQKRLGLAADKLKVIYPGVRATDYKPTDVPPPVATIGFLSRQCHDMGLDILTDTFIELKKRTNLHQIRLRISGGKRADDEAFIQSVRQNLSSAGVIDDVEFLPDFERASRLAFLQGLSVLSVPTRQPAAYGLFVVEALACAVPVVEPACGVFPELIEQTQGGLLYEPNKPASLADSLAKLLLNKDYASQLGKTGKEAVLEKFNIERSAQRLIDLYQTIRK
jgi:glycosyltransferase involved in cell wall biosynthesis